MSPGNYRKARLQRDWNQKSILDSEQFWTAEFGPLNIHASAGVPSLMFLRYSLSVILFSISLAATNWFSSDWCFLPSVPSSASVYS